jgi:hypothetical protein
MILILSAGMDLPSDNFEELKTFDASLVYDDERRAALVNLNKNWPFILNVSHYAF